ncbi:MAG TPA: ABC transporter permease [Bryobacteraceae bacterium]|nr:ABC transporter permease [Bryobacteraceae bacterium]
MYLLRLCHILLLRLGSLFRKAKVERDLDRELSFHFDQQVRENLAKGIPPEEARHAAQRSLGGFAQIQEECRDMRRTNQLDTIWNDLRYALRTLRRTPGFTIVIVLTLALSIGANSAIFSVIEGVLLRPLPYAHPDRIVRIFFNSDSYAKFPLNPYDLRDFRTRNRTFDSLAGIVRADVQLSGAGEPVMLRAFRVTGGYFRVLGFTPVSGREFTTADEVPAQGRLALLSDRLWRTRFASDRGIVGRTIMLNAQPHTVAGVMPPSVQHPGNDYHALADGDTVDLWIPYTYDGDPNQRGSHFMEGIGRLKPGVSPEQGNADLTTVLSGLANEHTSKDWRVFLVPLYREMVGRTERLLLVLLAAVGLLLLIACVNAANLLLAKSSARVREIAVRSALGAARGRIVRQLLTESLVIALAGAALGTVFAVGGVRGLVACLPAGFPRAAEIRLDSAVFAFTLLVAVLTGLLFGLVPALTSSRTDLQQSLREAGRGATGCGRQLRLRSFLVVGETALACVLLIAAGLMLHSFVNLLQADPGFRPQQVLTASISLPNEQYRKRAQIGQFYERLIGGLESLPGVQSAGVGSDLPWTGYDENLGGFTVEGRPPEFNDKTSARYHVASLDYFRSLGIPLLRGRFFTGHDDKDAPFVILVNEVMARRYWPGEDAVGKRICFSDKPQEKDWFRIAGVVGDVKDRPDSSGAQPAFWWPLAQLPFPIGDMSVALRSNSDPALLVNQLRLAVRQLDPGLAVADLRLMNQVAAASVSSQRFALFLVGLFAALALVLATIGIYGVISYSVNQRMHEFGMRMALGAGSWDLVRLIMGQGLTLCVAGAAIGLLGAAASTRLLRSLLYGVAGTDPVTFGAVAVLAIATTTLACYLPARRATNADPMSSLRSE